MSKITAFESLTLDGVMQAPGRPDEDTRGGFAYGGWAAPYADDVAAGVAAEGMSETGGLLFGRRTYEDFYGFWPNATDNPFTEVLNSTQKYVASTTLEEPLPWENSTLLKGDVPAAVSALRARPGRDIVVLGSGELLRSLMPHGLIDRYTLLIHPLVLGVGHRLFADAHAELVLIEVRPTSTGVMIATYEPRQRAERRPGGLR
jgi:dihydrofolate reductase